jgi:hypothetical protein
MSVTDYKVICFTKTDKNHIQDFVSIINDLLEDGYTLKGPTLMSWVRNSRCIFKQNLVKYSSQPSSIIKEFNLLYFETDCAWDGEKNNLDAIKTFEESIMKMIKRGFVLYEDIQIYDRYTESGDGKSVNLQALVKYESNEKNLLDI